MTDPSTPKTVYFDFRPNAPQNDDERARLHASWLSTFEARLPQIVERVWEIPALFLPALPSKDFTSLLSEARELYLHGYFYSCVAMSGIVGERMIKNLLQASIRLVKEEQVVTPEDKAIDRLEKLELSIIAKFLWSAGLLPEDAFRAHEALSELRNTYAHAQGSSPKEDAKKSIELMHRLMYVVAPILYRLHFRPS